MRRARLVATVVVVVLAIGCSRVGANVSPSPEVPSEAPSVAASASPSSAPSQIPPTAPTVSIGPSADPTPTAAPNQPTIQPTPCCESSPLPSPSHVAGLAASDRFWERWYDTCFFGAFPIVSSLGEITNQSDLVIKGAITDLYSRQEGSWQIAYVKVLIADVLKGEPVSREAGTIEVQIGFGADFEDLRTSLPVDDHLWFLVHEHTFDPRNEPGGYTYHTTDYAQVSVLREIGGVVEVIWPEAIADAYSRRHFPVTLDGTNFEELVDKVRQLAEGPSAAVHAYSRWSPIDEPDPNRFDAC